MNVSVVALSRQCRGIGFGVAVIACALLTAGCRPSTSTEKDHAEKSESVGSARIAEDGSLILSLDPKAVGGSEGDFRIVLPPDHEDYASYLERIGELEPGESKRLSSLPEGKP